MSFLLKEDGDKLLLETGDRILLEQSVDDSAEFTAEGSATGAFLGESLAGAEFHASGMGTGAFISCLPGVFVAAGEATGAFMAGLEAAAEFFASGMATGEFFAGIVSSGEFFASGSALGEFDGARRKSVTVIGGYTYDPFEGPIALPITFARREPAIRVSDALNDAPNSATYDIHEAQPFVGQKVTVDFGPGVLFEGPIQRVDQSFDEQRDQTYWRVTATDNIWLLNRRRPFGCYEGESISAVVADLLDRFAPEFTQDIEAGLPAWTGVFDGTESFAQVLSRLALSANAHWSMEQDTVKFFTEETGPNPDDIDDDNEDLLLDPRIESSIDISQVRNRVYGRGAGAEVMADAAPGSTVLQVDGLDLFESSGGQVFVGCQVLTYTGKTTVYTPVDQGETPGDTMDPFAKFEVTGWGARAVLGNFKGVAQYKVSFVKPGTGESALSAASSSITWLASNTQPTLTPTPSVNWTAGGNVPAGNHQYLLGWVVGGGSVRLSEAISSIPTSANPFSPGTANFTNLPTSAFGPGGVPDDPLVTAKILYRQVGSEYRQVAQLPLAQTTFSDTLADSSLGAPAPAEDPGTGGEGGPSGNGTHGITIIVSNIPLGETGTTARKLYRSLNGGPYNLLVTINDNTTTEYEDNSPGASGTLVPDPPAPIARHILTGIPTSGTGAIEHLVHAGETVYLWVQADDLTAQIELAEKEGGDGVHEDLVVDERYTTVASLLERCEAELLLFSRPIVTVTYATRDRKSKTGKTVVINLTDPPISATLKIQDVVIDQIHENDDLVERYTVTASTLRFTLDDLLRRARLLEN